MFNDLESKLQSLLEMYGSRNTAKMTGFDGLADKYAASLKSIMAQVGQYIDDLCRQVGHCGRGDG